MKNIIFLVKRSINVVLLYGVILFSLMGCFDTGREPKNEITAEVRAEIDKIAVFVASVRPVVSSWLDATMGCGVGSMQSCESTDDIYVVKIDIFSSIDLYPGHPSAELNSGWQIFNLYFHAYAVLIKADLIMIDGAYDKLATITLLKESTAHTARIFELIAEAKNVPKLSVWLDRSKMEINTKLLNLMLYSLIYHVEPTPTNKAYAIAALALIGGEAEWQIHGLYNERISNIVLAKERDVL